MPRCDQEIPLILRAWRPTRTNSNKTGKRPNLKTQLLRAWGKWTDEWSALAVMDFRFLGGSMGSVVGEKITRAIERGLDNKAPVIVVSASGGARMYEGILSLMQMAKTSAALAKLAKARIPFFSVLTNPTMAGVMASYASLGDVIIAEPEALIGFAGRRVIKETTRADLPEGFQTSEFLLEHGLIDQIVTRHDLRDRLINLMGYLAGPINAKAPKSTPPRKRTAPKKKVAAVKKPPAKRKPARKA